MPSSEPTRGNPLALVAAAVLLSVAASLLAVDLSSSDTAESPGAATTAAADRAPSAQAPAAAPAATAFVPAPATDEPENGMVAAGSTTAVSMVEFGFEMPDTFEAGSHTFEVVNAGLAPHEFALGVVGEHGGHLGQTAELPAGGTETITIELEPGTYEIGCHVPGHYEAGMTTTITVVG